MAMDGPGAPDRRGSSLDTRADPAPALPPEWWERLLGRIAGWMQHHETALRRLQRLRVVLVWLALLTALLVALVLPRLRSTLIVPMSGLAMLATIVVLCRSRTVAWNTVSMWYSACLAWSIGIAVVTATAAKDLVPLFDEHILTGGLGVNSQGAGTAVAAFGEECLKLLPLALLAAAAPGRVRRFSVADWLLLGYASGLAFMVVEETARAFVLTVSPGILDLFLLDLSPDFTWWPFAGRSFELTGELTARYGGHHVLTGLVAGCTGLGVWWWRRGGAARVAGVAFPVLAWWVAVVDHFGYNATSHETRWLGGELSTAPSILQASFRLTGQGYGREWLLGAVFVVALIVDSRVLRPAGDTSPRGILPWVRDLLDRTRLEVATVLTAYQVSADGSRTDAARRGRTVAMAVRADRALAFARVGEVAELVADGDPRRLLRRRRTTRLLGAAVAVVLVLVGVALAAWLAARIGPLLWDFAGDWLAGLMDRLGQWWNGLPWWAQVLITAAMVATIVVATVATGGTFLAGLSWGMGVSGVATYTASHGQGVASLLRDPRGASADYVRTVTPGGLVLDLAEFGLTFVPGSALGGIAGRAGTRLFVRSADDAARGAGMAVRATDDVARALAIEPGTDAAGLLDDLGVVQRHLVRPGISHSPANDAMIARIRVAAADGRPLHPSEADFLRHELSEATLMDGGMGYDEAHALAGGRHPTFGNYHPDVIDEFAELFNRNWRAYWGLEP